MPVGLVQFDVPVDGRCIDIRLQTIDRNVAVNHAGGEPNTCGNPNQEIDPIFAFRADHDPNILIFDVPLPFLSRGLDAYMATWETFFSQAEKPVVFNFHDVEITAGVDVAFATATGQCVDIDSKGKREELEFRLTMGLRKISGRWRIMHEHHSLPAA
jgi:ketosteroid isomerase-like protein